MARRWTSLVLGSALALLGCKEEEPATQITVSIHSDLSIGDQLTRIEVELLAQDGDARGQDRSFDVERLPLSFGVTRGTTDRIRVVVTGFGLDDAGAVGEEVKADRLHAALGRAPGRIDVANTADFDPHGVNRGKTN